MNNREFMEMVERAKEASAAGEVWTAAVLYERLHDAALEKRREDWSRWTLRKAAECWTLTSDPDRGLHLLLHALHEARPADAERYWLHRVFVIYAMYLDVPVDDMDGQLVRLAELAVDVWGHEGSDPAMLSGQLLRLRGDWNAALGAFERAWADRDSPGPQKSQTHIASSAARTALRLGRRGEAQRWGELSALHVNAAWERNRAGTTHLCLAVFDNDAPAARAASRALEALVSPQLPAYRADATNLAVYALLLEETQGDPAYPAHLARLRLKQQTDDGVRTVDDHYNRHHALVCLELASLRYAAGMAPLDDAYHRQPDPPPDPDRIRLPDEIAKRLAVVHEACDTALTHAREADTRFGCSWRQQEIADLRDRGERMAQALWHRDRPH